MKFLTHFTHFVLLWFWDQTKMIKCNLSSFKICSYDALLSRQAGPAMAARNPFTTSALFKTLKKTSKFPPIPTPFHPNLPGMGHHSRLDSSSSLHDQRRAHEVNATTMVIRRPLSQGVIMIRPSGGQTLAGLSAARGLATLRVFSQY
jgi:hypothetical protein